MIVLGIETSCDETGVALLEVDAQRCSILAERISSQVDLHALYGGVVPELASREHLRSLPILLEQLLNDAGRSLTDVDLLGVTVGPGLKGCLLIGLAFAQGIAEARRIPLVPVNHIEGHLVSPQLTNPHFSYPYLGLVVSGGHTELLCVRGLGEYDVIARTRDDAAGEAFDKSASLLGIEYPGGPRLAKLADTVQASRFTLPKVSREMTDFSFSGLKTAVALLVERNRGVLASETAAKAEAAFVIQETIVDALVHKAAQARKATGIENIAVVGGVSANRRLRQRMAELWKEKACFPPMAHCMDNGAMIALAAARRFEKGTLPAVDIKSRWFVEEIDL